MPASDRRERRRAERHRLILDTARTIAEADGWDAVTTRRLAERIEYSQPVLYSHFAGLAQLRDVVVVRGSGVPAGAATTPAPLRAGFDALRDTLDPDRPRDPGTATEVFWAALHGLATLTAAGRLRPDRADERLALLVARTLRGE